MEREAFDAGAEAVAVRRLALLPLFEVVKELRHALRTVGSPPMSTSESTPSTLAGSGSSVVSTSVWRKPAKAPAAIGVFKLARSMVTQRCSSSQISMKASQTR